MARRPKAAPPIKALAAAALAIMAVLAAVGLIAPSPRRESAVATQRTAAVQAPKTPLRPSYVVRIPPPAPPGAAEPMRAPVSLSVRPVTPEAPAERTEKWYVTARALNVRAEPSSQSQPVAALPRGTAVDVSERQGNWVQVTAGDVTGWAFVKYLSQTAP